MNCPPPLFTKKSIFPKEDMVCSIRDVTFRKETYRRSENMMCLRGGWVLSPLVSSRLLSSPLVSSHLLLHASSHLLPPLPLNMIPQPTPWNFPALKAMGFGLVGGRGGMDTLWNYTRYSLFSNLVPRRGCLFSHGTSVETVKIAFANGTNDPLPHSTSYMTYSIVRKTSVPLLPQTLVPMGEGWVGFF